MIKRSENLPFVAEAFLHEGGVKSAAHQLDGYFLGVLPICTNRAIHLTHAAVPDFFNDLVDTDATTRTTGRRKGRGLECEGRILQKCSSGLFMRGEQRFDFVPEFGIPAAGMVEVRCALHRVDKDDLVEQLLHLLPAFGVHAGASPVMARNNQARAVTQSRFTVAGEMPSTSEVSSMVRPAKKRSSTIRPCCASKPESSPNALSSATTSTSVCCGRATASSRVRVSALPPRLAALRPRAYSTRICRMIWAAIPNKCARFCHWGGFCPARRRYASCTKAVLCRV